MHQLQTPGAQEVSQAGDGGVRPADDPGDDLRAATLAVSIRDRPDLR